MALAGSNEDWGDPNTQMWFVPATKDTYGMVYFGFGRGEYPKGGVPSRKLTIPEGGITRINPVDLYGFPPFGTLRLAVDSSTSVSTESRERD